MLATAPRNVFGILYNFPILWYCRGLYAYNVLPPYCLHVASKQIPYNVFEPPPLKGIVFYTAIAKQTAHYNVTRHTTALYLAIDKIYRSEYSGMVHTGYITTTDAYIHHWLHWHISHALFWQ